MHVLRPENVKEPGALFTVRREFPNRERRFFNSQQPLIAAQSAAPVVMQIQRHCLFGGMSQRYDKFYLGTERFLYPRSCFLGVKIGGGCLPYPSFVPGSAKVFPEIAGNVVRIEIGF